MKLRKYSVCVKFLFCGYNDTENFRLYHNPCSVTYTVTSAGRHKTCQLTAQLINNGVQGQGQDIEPRVFVSQRRRTALGKKPTNVCGKRQTHSSKTQRYLTPGPAVLTETIKFLPELSITLSAFKPATTFYTFQSTRSLSFFCEKQLWDDESPTNKQNTNGFCSPDMYNAAK